MISTDTIKYLVDWLVSEIKPKYEASKTKKYAEGGFKPLKGVMSDLWQMFNGPICEAKDKVFLIADNILYVYNGRHYEKITEKTFFKELIKRVLAELGVNSVYQINASAVIAKECFDWLRNDAECQFEPDRRYVCFKNGVFDLKDNKLKPFRINYCTDIVLDFDYRTQKDLDIESAKEFGISWEKNYARLWGRKLNEIIPNKNLQKDFQQFCGSLLIKRDEIKTEYICYLYGAGCNGKSTLASAIANMLGEDYYTTFSPQEIFRQGANSTFVVNEMDGKLLNLCDDMDSSKDFSGGKMKGLSSGEKVTGRGMYSSEFKKVQPPLMLCCTNFFPDTMDDSWGHHRRQMIIECTNSVPGEIDHELGAKLRTDVARQQIFLWVYEGYRKVVSNKGIELSEDCKNAILRRRDNSSPMRIWATERGLVKAVPTGDKDPRWRKLTDLYAMYRGYCAENGFKAANDARKVSAMFVSMGAEKKRAGQGYVLCVGIKGVDTDEGGGLIIKGKS